MIRHLENHENLDPSEVKVAADFLLDEGADLSQKEHLLEALSAKGETAEEIAEFVSAFLEKAVEPAFVDWGFEGPTIDVCGTGGDQLDLFNVSTTCMFVVAAAGAVVVKHGNRGITSKSGGADVLEALGIQIDLPSEKVGECLAEAGVGFLFAPKYHPAFKAVVPVRAALAKRGIRTIFNLIGPLLNPAHPECQLVGVFEKSLCPVFADILGRLGRKRAWAVHGMTADGRAVDEVSLMGPTRICQSGSLQKSVDEEIQVGDFGMTHANLTDLQGGGAEENAQILKSILSGQNQGPQRDMVVLNAAAAITCAGIADHMQDGVKLAQNLIDSGAAMDRLAKLQQLAS